MSRVVQTDDRLRAAKVSAVEEHLSDRLVRLTTLNLGELREEWRRLTRSEPPRLSRDMMARAVAYRIQEIAFGGLSKATRRQLAALSGSVEREVEIAQPPRPRIQPGARLVREWHGRTHEVTVVESGFEFDGQTFRSLSMVARAITGARWSGPRFFGLIGRQVRQIDASKNITFEGQPLNESVAAISSSQSFSGNSDG